MKTVAVILAGGYGNRLNGYKNPLKCKPLIRNGKGYTLLRYTLRAVELSDTVDEVIIVGREARKEQLLQECEGIGLPIIYVDNQGAASARAALLLSKDAIGDSQFYLLCGHAPPTASHLSRMKQFAHKGVAQVVTCYPYPGKRVGVIQDTKSLRIKKFLLDKPPDKLDRRNTYSIDTPLLLNPNIIDLLAKDNCAFWYSHYFVNQHEEGEQLYGIPATFPKEADTKAELIETLRFVDGLEIPSARPHYQIQTPYLKREAPIIAVDIGGTIEDTWNAKRLWFCEKGIDIGPHPLGRIQVEEMLGQYRSLYKQMAEDVYSDNGILSHGVVSGALEALAALSEHYCIHLLSTRPKNKQNVTLAWLESVGLLAYIEGIEFIGNTVGLETYGPSETKLQRCESLGAVALVDDDERHLTTVGGENRFPYIQRILLQSHSRQAFETPNICVLNTWLEVTNQLLSQILRTI